MKFVNERVIFNLSPDMLFELGSALYVLLLIFFFGFKCWVCSLFCCVCIVNFKMLVTSHLGLRSVFPVYWWMYLVCEVKGFKFVKISKCYERVIWIWESLSWESQLVGIRSSDFFFYDVGLFDYFNFGGGVGWK